MSKFNSMKKSYISNGCTNLNLTPPPTRISVLENGDFRYCEFFNKVLPFILFCFSISYLPLNAQSLPPSGKFRGMYVSCGDELIRELYGTVNSAVVSPVLDMTIGTTCTTKINRDLLNYAHDNNITYIALYGMSTVVGLNKYDLSIKEFLLKAHTLFSGYRIEVGVVVSNLPFVDMAAANKNFITSNFYFPFSGQLDCGAKVLPGLNSWTTIPDSIINPPNRNELNNAADYRRLERSEMIKQILAVKSYTYFAFGKTRNSPTLSDEGGEDEDVDSSSADRILQPVNQDILFDYLSLEYEYWNAGLIDKKVNNTTNTYLFDHNDINLTPDRIVWDNFRDIVWAMAIATKDMCWYTKMEMELTLKTPRDQNSITPLSLNFTPLTSNNVDDPYPSFPLPTDKQAQFINYYFHRCLTNDYVLNYTFGDDLLSRTAHEVYWLGANPAQGSVAKVVPLFSAATAGEQKHCFGIGQTTTVGTTTSPENWPQSFMGPVLASSTPTITMGNIEADYMSQTASGYTQLTMQTHPNETAIGPVVIPAADFQTNTGFMWFNYSTLYNNNTSNTPQNHTYHREMQVNYSTSSNILNIGLAELNSNCVLSITDMLGRNIEKFELKENSSAISLSHLSYGLYNVTIVSNGNCLINKKIVVNP